VVPAALCKNVIICIYGKEPFAIRKKRLFSGTKKEKEMHDIYFFITDMILPYIQYEAETMEIVKEDKMIITKYSKEQMKEIGQRIKTARMEHGLSQGQLCERARIPSTKIVSKFELGLDVPKDDRLKKIADTLHVSAEYILDGDTTEKNRKEAAMAMGTKQIEAGPEAETAVEHSEQSVEETGEVPAVEQAVEHSEQPVEETREASSATSDNHVKKPKTAKAAKSRKKTKGKRSKASDSAVRKKSGYAWPKSDRLMELREQGGFTLKEIADFCGLTRQSVVYWESQRNKISLYDAAKLAELYGVSVDELVFMKKEQAEQLASEPAAATAPAVTAQPEKQEQAAPLEIPENPEEMFCRNVRYFLSQKGCSDQEFEAAVGCEPSFFDDVQKDGWNWKIPLGVVLRTASFLGKTVEELVCDTKAAEIEAMAVEYERKARELRQMIGII
jgi:transcriptional regulator with XRE-family HTH domain